jgi:hypothetical protein
VKFGKRGKPKQIPKEFAGMGKAQGLIMSMKNSGLSDEEIMSQTDLSQHRLRRVFSDIAALNPGQFERVFGSPENCLYIFLDECSPPTVISDLYPKFGYMKHVKHLGLGGTPDPKLYDMVAGLQPGIMSAPYHALFTFDQKMDSFEDIRIHALRRAFFLKDKPEKQRDLPLLVNIERPKLPITASSVDQLDALIAILCHHQPKITDAIKRREGPILDVFASTNRDPELLTTYEDLPDFFKINILKQVSETQFPRIHPVAALARRIVSATRGAVAPEQAVEAAMSSREMREGSLVPVL